MMVMMTLTNEELIRVNLPAGDMYLELLPGVRGLNLDRNWADSSHVCMRNASGFPKRFRTFVVLIRQHWSTVMTHDCAENSDLVTEIIGN